MRASMSGNRRAQVGRLQPGRIGLDCFHLGLTQLDRMDSRRERRIEGWADTCDTQKCRMRIKRVKGQESLPPVAKRAQRTEGWRRPDTHPGPVGTDPVAAPAVFSGQGFAKPGITLADYQEIRIRNFERTIDTYMALAPFAASLEELQP